MSELKEFLHFAIFIVSGQGPVSTNNLVLVNTAISRILARPRGLSKSIGNGINNITKDVTDYSSNLSTEEICDSKYDNIW